MKDNKTIIEQLTDKLIPFYRATDGMETPDAANPAISDEYLKQFGVKRLTGIRNAIDEETPIETPIDYALLKEGLLGAHNNHTMQYFVCEKDGIEFLLFIEWGIWSFGIWAWQQQVGLFNPDLDKIFPERRNY